MQTIAQMAGVSTTTVSLALRGHSSISDQTKRRIKELQQSLGYQFSSRQTKSKQPRRPNLEQIIYRTVGVNMRVENYAPFLNGIVSECRLRAIKLELDSVPASDSIETDMPSLGSLHKRGVILSGRVTDREIEEVERSGLPYVILGNYYLNRPIHMVGTDLVDAAERAMQDLVNEGMVRTVFFVEIQDRPYEREFLRFLRGILLDLGIPQENIALVQAGAEFRNIKRAASEVLKLIKPDSRIVILERHCAEALVQAMRCASHREVAKREIVAFVNCPYRLLNFGYRAFDLGGESCGRLAVARLAEFQRNPNLPINSSFVRSPGWIS